MLLDSLQNHLNNLILYITYFRRFVNVEVSSYLHCVKEKRQRILKSYLEARKARGLSVELIPVMIPKMESLKSHELLSYTTDR